MIVVSGFEAKEAATTADRPGNAADSFNVIAAGETTRVDAGESVTAITTPGSWDRAENDASVVLEAMAVDKNTPTAPTLSTKSLGAEINTGEGIDQFRDENVTSEGVTLMRDESLADNDTDTCCPGWGLVSRIKYTETAGPDSNTVIAWWLTESLGVSLSMTTTDATVLMPWYALSSDDTVWMTFTVLSSAYRTASSSANTETVTGIDQFPEENRTTDGLTETRLSTLVVSTTVAADAGTEDNLTSYDIEAPSGTTSGVPADMMITPGRMSSTTVTLIVTTLPLKATSFDHRECVIIAERTSKFRNTLSFIGITWTNCGTFQLERENVRSGVDSVTTAEPRETFSVTFTDEAGTAESATVYPTPGLERFITSEDELRINAPAFVSWIIIVTLPETSVAKLLNNTVTFTFRRRTGDRTKSFTAETTNFCGTAYDDGSNHSDCGVTTSALSSVVGTNCTARNGRQLSHTLMFCGDPPSINGNCCDAAPSNSTEIPTASSSTIETGTERANPLYEASAEAAVTLREVTCSPGSYHTSSNAATVTETTVDQFDGENVTKLGDTDKSEGVKHSKPPSLQSELLMHDFQYECTDVAAWTQ
jgi:hypothetical protein